MDAADPDSPSMIPAMDSHCGRTKRLRPRARLVAVHRGHAHPTGSGTPTGVREAAPNGAARSLFCVASYETGRRLAPIRFLRTGCPFRKRRACDGAMGSSTVPGLSLVVQPALACPGSRLPLLLYPHEVENDAEQGRRDNRRHNADPQTDIAGHTSDGCHVHTLHGSAGRSVVIPSKRCAKLDFGFLSRPKGAIHRTAKGQPAAAPVKPPGGHPDAVW